MNLLYFTILIPLLSFFLLACYGKRWQSGSITVIGVSSIGLVCLLVAFVGLDFYFNSKANETLIYSRYLWQWFSVDDFTISISLMLDGLSLVFLAIVVVTGFLIHLYAVGYMSKNESYAFFAYGNLLMASMIVLVLADNLFVMLLGWEGVSLCSYLLVGFHHKQLKNSYAAVRTFIIMHIGDIFLLIGLFLIYDELHALNIRDILALATDKLAVDSEIIYWITLMLFCGAIGKSAQLPLQTWLTDSTAAPMPALTLIHSASAMLAGVYLIIRLNGLFIMSSDIFTIIGVIACLTLLFASCTALVQNDIKRIVTYMSLSQISYVFMAISVQAWQSAITYLISYTVFSTLLFLASATVIKACGGERDIFRMGGLYKKLPFVYFSLLVAGASLSTIPWITASFLTKGEIIWSTIIQQHLGFGSIGLVGVLLSALCVFRFIFIVFHNKPKIHTTISISKVSYIPLAFLMILSTGFFAYIPLPLSGLVPPLDITHNGLLSFQLLLASVSILGILITYMLYAGKNAEINDIANSPLGRSLTQLWYHGWRIEWLYHTIFECPYLWLTKRLQKDPLTLWVNSITWSIRNINTKIAVLENGHLRWYIMSIVGGGVLVLLLLVFS